MEDLTKVVKFRDPVSVGKFRETLQTARSIKPTRFLNRVEKWFVKHKDDCADWQQLKFPFEGIVMAEYATVMVAPQNKYVVFDLDVRVDESLHVLWHKIMRLHAVLILSQRGMVEPFRLLRVNCCLDPLTNHQTQTAYSRVEQHENRIRLPLIHDLLAFFGRLIRKSQRPLTQEDKDRASDVVIRPELWLRVCDETGVIDLNANLRRGVFNKLSDPILFAAVTCELDQISGPLSPEGINGIVGLAQLTDVRVTFSGDQAKPTDDILRNILTILDTTQESGRHFEKLVCEDMSLEAATLDLLRGQMFKQALGPYHYLFFENCLTAGQPVQTGTPPWYQAPPIDLYTDDFDPSWWPVEKEVATPKEIGWREVTPRQIPNHPDKMSSHEYNTAVTLAGMVNNVTLDYLHPRPPWDVPEPMPKRMKPNGPQNVLSVI
jgi:hypothetical protein